jgi:hypothetical protein
MLPLCLSFSLSLSLSIEAAQANEYIVDAAPDYASARPRQKVKKTARGSIPTLLSRDHKARANLSLYRKSAARELPAKNENVEGSRRVNGSPLDYLLTYIHRYTLELLLARALTCTRTQSLSVSLSLSLSLFPIFLNWSLDVTIIACWPLCLAIRKKKKTRARAAAASTNDYGNCSSRPLPLCPSTTPIHPLPPSPHADQPPIQPCHRY